MVTSMVCHSFEVSTIKPCEIMSLSYTLDAFYIDMVVIISDRCNSHDHFIEVSVSFELDSEAVIVN